MRRQRMPRGKSKRLFSRTGARKHRKNFGGSPMRGGIRL